MDPVLGRLIDHFDRLHEACKSQFAGLDSQALDWSPGEGMNSIAVLATHTAGSEKFWIGDIVMREPSGRNREAEFTVTGTDAAGLAALLDASLAHVRGALERLSLKDLSEPRTSPLDGVTYDIAWSIAQSLQHTALHLGHMQLTRQLLEASRAGS